MEMMYDGKEDRIRLPRNIKQVGKDNGNIKIYIEDYAYSFIKDIHVDRDEDGRIGVLLGEVINEDDLTYIMVKGAAEVTNAAVFKEKIAFTEETWPVVNKIVKTEFQGMSIVGWYLVSSRITMNHMEVIKKAHRENFKEKNNIFFMYNPADADESFYTDEDSWNLMDGFKVFYERNEQMQTYMADYRQYNQTETGEYRKAINNSQQVSKSVKRHLTFVYGLSMLLLIVVLIIGVNAINNKPDSGNYTTQAAVDVAGVDKTVAVETEEETKAATEAPTEAPTQEPTKPKETKEETKAETKPEPTTAEPTKPAYTTYTIAQGDTLYKVSEKFYGSASIANIEKIVAYNGLDSASGLRVGDVIKIPQ